MYNEISSKIGLKLRVNECKSYAVKFCLHEIKIVSKTKSSEKSGVLLHGGWVSVVFLWDRNKYANSGS